MISYGIAWFHFVSEFVVFGTAGLKGAISPFIVSSESQSSYLALLRTVYVGRALRLTRLLSWKFSQLRV